MSSVVSSLKVGFDRGFELLFKMRLVSSINAQFSSGSVLVSDSVSVTVVVRLVYLQLNRCSSDLLVVKTNQIAMPKVHFLLKLRLLYKLQTAFLLWLETCFC